MSLMDFLAPVIGTFTIIAVCALIAFAIHLFLEKTQIGQSIKAATPWMGWYSDVDDEHTNFVIHPSNYRKAAVR